MGSKACSEFKSHGCRTVDIHYQSQLFWHLGYSSHAHQEAANSFIKQLGTWTSAIIPSYLDKQGNISVTYLTFL